MADLERINQAQLNNALTAQDASLQRSLSSEDLSILLSEMDLMARRWPSQDQEESIEVWQVDLERLALKYSLPLVRAALAELRIRPGQRFCPRPDEVAEEIERQREQRVYAARDRESKAQSAEWELGFWKWVDESLARDPSLTEQALLDSVRTPGYTGRKARMDCKNRKPEQKPSPPEPSLLNEEEHHATV